MAVDVILGLQWGDEGKGKIVDVLANQYDMVCRFQGGPNAGHTIIIGNDKHVLHTVPSGIFREGMINLIGNGVVIDPITLQKEINNLTEAGVEIQDRLVIAKKAHLILPTHRLLDAASEASKGKNKIGSTLKGIGPTYMDKTGRNGLRVGDILTDRFKAKYDALKAKHLNIASLHPKVEFDLDAEEQKWFAAIELIKKFSLVDGEYIVNEALNQGKKILAEGAQGSMLDIDFGTYPYVTSSNTITAGVCTGLGIAPQNIGDVIGITKAYCTRVGAGPFPTQLDDADGEKLRAIGKEFGATTGRPRRCGWIDLPQLKYTIMLNGVTKLVMTKLDVLNDFEKFGAAVGYEYDGIVSDKLPYDINAYEITPQYKEIKGWQSDLESAGNYSELPYELKTYIDFIEKELATPVEIVSIGPKRKQILHKEIEQASVV